MVYEYCKEIQNSGINMNAFPTSCGSFMEMGLYVVESSIREVNNIFMEAGLIELDKYTNNTITEASAGELVKTVGGAIKKALVKAWEGIKAVWKKIYDTINTKIDNFYKSLGQQFENLDLTPYKEAINDKIKDMKFTTLAVDEADKMLSNLDSVKEKLSTQITTDLGKGNTDQSVVNSYSIFNMYSKITEALPNGEKVEGASGAKKFVKDHIYAGNYTNINADWIINNRHDIIEIIKTKANSEVKKAYSSAKKSVDKAMRELDNVNEESNLKEYSRSVFNLELAYQTLVLEVASCIKDALDSAIVIAGNCVAICKKGNENK